MSVKKNCKFLLILFGLLSLILSFQCSQFSAYATQSKKQNFSTNYTLTGNGGTDMVAIASAQIGKTGKQLGYTEDWCADFVSDCATLAGQSSAIPAHGRADYLDSNILKAGGYKVSKSNAQPGDIAFYDNNYNNSPDHVEIVYQVSGSTVKTFGGNTGSTGSYSTNKVSSPRTYGNILYIIRPNYNNTSISTCPTWTTLSTQDNRNIFNIGEQVQFKMNSDNAKYYVIGIDYEGKRIVTSSLTEGYDLYCYAFNFSGNYTAYVSAYNGDNHIESNIVSFKVIDNSATTCPTWANLSTQDNRIIFNIGEQVQFKMSSDNAKYYVIGIDYEGERIVTSPLAEGYDLYCYAFNFSGNYTAYVSAYNGDNHVESNVINFKVYPKADIGTDFYAYIMNPKVQKYLTAESNNNVDVKSKISRFGSPEQVWKFTRKEDGSYKITNCKNKLALDSTETTEPKANVYTYQDCNNECQSWDLFEQSDSYFLKSKYTECVMDIDGGKTDEGTNVQMYTKNDTAAQAFQILKIENYTIKIPGDLNQDGTLSLTDLIPLQQSLLRQTTLTADQAQLADYNGDGSINVLDLMLLKRALLAL